MGSKKPCPGCGRVSPYRPANSVCASCRTLIELGKIHKAERAVGEEKSDVEWICVPVDWSFLPRFGTDELVIAIHKLMLLIGKALYQEDVRFVYNANVPHKEYGGHYTDTYTTNVCVPKGTRDVLSNIIEQIRVSLNKSYDDGAAYGRNMVRRLADGDVSVKDFYL